VTVSKPQTSSNLIRWGGLAAMLGGALWAVKGGVIMLGAPDPDLLIPAELFFALGLLGLHARLAGRGGGPTKIGGLLAYVALALSAINAPYSLFFAEDGPQTPFPFNVTYFAASVAIFVGLVLLGLAVWRTGLLPPRWRVLPLALGLSALLPVWALALVHLELPVVLLGLGWMLLGYAAVKKIQPGQPRW
jgi:hypothetical protein